MTKVVDEEMKEPEKKEEAKDAPAYDALMKKMDDMITKMSDMFPKKEEEKKSEDAPLEKKEEPAQDEPLVKAEEKSEDDDKVEASIEERVKALEAAISKLLEGTQDEKEEESEESKDEDESEESEDSEEEKENEKKKTGDASRVEILAPGLKAEGKGFKANALKVAYATKDGKAVIDTISGGKPPQFDSEALFIAASEVLKSKRGSGLENTKSVSFETFDHRKEEMTAEKMNELNQAYWARK